MVPWLPFSEGVKFLFIVTFVDTILQKKSCSILMHDVILLIHIALNVTGHHVAMLHCFTYVAYFPYFLLTPAAQSFNISCSSSQKLALTCADLKYVIY